MIASLTPFNPDRLQAVDRVDERASMLLARAGIRPGPDGDTAAMVIFRWLLHMTSGKAGSVAGVTAATLAGVTQGKESAAREAIKLLDDKGLVCLAPIGSVERPNRRSPYVIHVLEQAMPPAQRTFEFAERPTATPVLRVTHGSPATPTDLCTKPFVQSFVQSPLHKAELQPVPPNPPRTDATECVADAVVKDSSTTGMVAGESALAHDVQRVGASNHQPNQSLLNQSQTTQASKIREIAQEVQRRQAEAALDRDRRESRRDGPSTLGRAIDSVAVGIFERFANAEQRQADVQRLVAEVQRALPFPTLSRQWVDHACAMAHTDQQLDGQRPFGPADVRRIVRYAKVAKNPAAAFHAAVKAELSKRCLALPATAKGGA
jgi:hypothetical protein